MSILIVFSAYLSFDVRGSNLEDGKHWSAAKPFGGRAFFRVDSKPAYLLINDVNQEVSEVLNIQVETVIKDPLGQFLICSAVVIMILI